MNPMYFSRPTSSLMKALLVVAMGSSLVACKIERKQVKDHSASSEQSVKGYDPHAEVETLWSSKAVPAIEAMAGNFPELLSAMKTNLDAAGAKHGHREQAEGAPWYFATKVRGTIVQTDTELSAGTADVDVDGDGKADVQLQIGPVVKGTAIRDILPFLSFSNYPSQIEFAQLANALNDRAYASALKQVDREKLKGRQVDVVGVFVANDVSALPVMTVISFKERDKK
jgi:predicted lipoprotein